MIEIILDINQKKLLEKKFLSSFPQNTKEMKNDSPLINLVTKEISQKNYSFKLSNADSYIVTPIIIYPLSPPFPRSSRILPYKSAAKQLHFDYLSPSTSKRNQCSRQGNTERVSLQRRGNDKRSVEACAHGLTHVSMKKEDCRHGTRNPSRSLVQRYFRLISRVVNQPRRETNLTSRESDLR